METKKIVKYELDTEIISVTHTTLDRILKHTTNPTDCIALYMFYVYTAKWQHSNQPRSVESYCLKGLNLGKVRFRNAKNELKKLGLIEDIQKKDGSKFGMSYIKVNYIIHRTSDSETIGKTDYKCSVLVKEMPFTDNTDTTSSVNFSKSEKFTASHIFEPVEEDFTVKKEEVDTSSHSTVPNEVPSVLSDTYEFSRAPILNKYGKDCSFFELFTIDKRITAKDYMSGKYNTVYF